MTSTVMIHSLWYYRDKPQREVKVVAQFDYNDIRWIVFEDRAVLKIRTLKSFRETFKHPDPDPEIPTP